MSAERRTQIDGAFDLAIRDALTEMWTLAVEAQRRGEVLSIDWWDQAVRDLSADAEGEFAKVAHAAATRALDELAHESRWLDGLLAEGRDLDEGRA